MPLNFHCIRSVFVSLIPEKNHQQNRQNDLYKSFDISNNFLNITIFLSYISSRMMKLSKNVQFDTELLSNQTTFVLNVRVPHVTVPALPHRKEQENRQNDLYKSFDISNIFLKITIFLSYISSKMMKLSKNVQYDTELSESIRDLS